MQTAGTGVGLPGCRAGSSPVIEGDSMEPGLPPDACLDLQIHLDRLIDAEERCRDGLRRLSRGTLTRKAYEDLFRRQRAAQAAWESRHAKYRSYLAG